MYPLKLLCKQYTNQSFSAILSEGTLPLGRRRAVLSRGSWGKSRAAGRAGRHLALVACPHDCVRGPDCGGSSEALPGPRPLPPSRGSPVSLPRRHCVLFSPFPSRRPPASLRFPRDPSPPHTPSHPVTETNDKITNPRSTDMFTRTTYALTKSKWERDQGKKRLQSISEDSVQP